MAASLPNPTAPQNAYPPSPEAIRAGREAVASLTGDPDWSALRRSVAQVHGIPDAQILCGAGLAELTGALIGAFVGSGEMVLGSCFDDGQAAAACHRVQGVYLAADELGYAVTVEELVKRVTPHTKVIYLSNPGPLTGTYIANAKLMELRAVLAPNVLLVLDQAYGEFGDMAQNRAQLYPLVEAGNTVILRSFSNAYGLAESPVGWGYFPADLVASIRALLPPGSLSAVSQAMAVAAMQDQPHLHQTVQRVGEVRDRLASGLRKIGITVPASYANFVLMQFDTDEVAQMAAQFLAPHGFAVRPMTAAGLSNSLQMTIGSQADMERLLALLSEASS